MKATKTLGWFQKHPHAAAVFVNVQTTVTDDNGLKIAQGGEDLNCDGPGIMAAALALEEAILAATGSELPAAPAAPAAAE